MSNVIFTYMQETHAAENKENGVQVPHIFNFCNWMSKATPFEFQLLPSNKMVRKASLGAVAGSLQISVSEDS
jgi:hypothetical protein